MRKRGSDLIRSNKKDRGEGLNPVRVHFLLLSFEWKYQNSK